MQPRLQKLANSFSKMVPSNISQGRFSEALGKPVPFWSLLLIFLLGSVSGLAAPAVVSLMARGSNPPPSPDFTIAASVVSTTLSQGLLVTFNIDMTSLDGFAGSVSLAAALSPLATNSSIALNPQTISLFTGSGTSRLTLSAGPATPTGSYRLTVNGTSGRLSHGVTVFVTVTPPPPPDFSITATPSALTISAGSSGFSTILVTSLYGFIGNVTLTASVLPAVSNGPTLTVNPATVTLADGGTQGSSLVVTTSGNTPRSDYTILVVGASGSVSHSMVLSLAVR